MQTVLAYYIGGARTFFEGWFHGYIMWVAEIWFDALVVDCLWFCHSKKMIIPGTEDLVDAYHDYWHHIKYAVIGMFSQAVIALPVGLFGDVAMIIQTGMRTDIPAFYSEWLMNRIQEGFVLVRNPYNPTQVTKYSLSPEVVDLIAFCTKNPAPMLPFMEQLTPYGQYWFVTITPYGRDIEPNVPDTGTVMDHFKILSDIVGVDSIGWRYDPILVDATHTVEWHISEFEKMAAVLHGYTETCVISFIDIYKKVERNFPEAKAVSRRDRITIGKALIEIATKYGMTVRPCAEGNDLAAYGADCSGCMTVATFEKALHNRLEIPKRKINQRNGACACVLGVDIGAYDTCGHLCKYCYANADVNLVKENRKNIIPNLRF